MRFFLKMICKKIRNLFPYVSNERYYSLLIRNLLIIVLSKNVPILELNVVKLENVYELEIRNLYFYELII
jgi:hypothetical protein